MFVVLCLCVARVIGDLCVGWIPGYFMGLRLPNNYVTALSWLLQRRVISAGSLRVEARGPLASLPLLLPLMAHARICKLLMFFL